MRPAIILLALALSACGTASNSQNTLAGPPTLANSGAGPQPGASAGATAGGGTAGAGTVDSAGGAK